MQGKVRRTCRAQPEVLPFADFAPIAIEALRFGHECLSQKQFAFVKRSKRDGTSRIRAFMQHGLGPVFSGRGSNFGQEMHKATARWLPTR